MPAAPAALLGMHPCSREASMCAGVDAVASQPAYSASKWGLHGWSESCYGNLRDKGIKASTDDAHALPDCPLSFWRCWLRTQVCCIAPGYVDRSAWLARGACSSCAPHSAMLRLPAAARCPPADMNHESMIKARSCRLDGCL